MQRIPPTNLLPALALLGALAPAGACTERRPNEPNEPATEKLPEAERSCSDVIPKRNPPAIADETMHRACRDSARATAVELCGSNRRIDSNDVTVDMSQDDCVREWLDGSPIRQCTTKDYTSPTTWVRDEETWPALPGLGERCEQLAANPPEKAAFRPDCDAASTYLTCVRARMKVDEKCDTPGCELDSRFGTPAVVRTTHTSDREVVEQFDATTDNAWNRHCVDRLWDTLVNCLE